MGPMFPALTRSVGRNPAQRQGIRLGARTKSAERSRGGFPRVSLRHRSPVDGGRPTGSINRAAYTRLSDTFPAPRPTFHRGMDRTQPSPRNRGVPNRPGQPAPRPRARVRPVSCRSSRGSRTCSRRPMRTPTMLEAARPDRRVRRREQVGPQSPSPSVGWTQWAARRSWARSAPAQRERRTQRRRRWRHRCKPRTARRTSRSLAEAITVCAGGRLAVAWCGIDHGVPRRRPARRSLVRSLPRRASPAAGLRFLGVESTMKGLAGRQLDVPWCDLCQGGPLRRPARRSVVRSLPRRASPAAGAARHGAAFTR